MVTVKGFAFSQITRDWSEEVTYIARDRMEAFRWMAFNQDWFKGLHIIEV